MLNAYWFESKTTGRVRRTPVVAPSVKEARQNLKRPSSDDARLVKSRPLNKSEREQVRQGKWIKGDYNRSGRGYGPKPKKR